MNLDEGFKFQVNPYWKIILMFYFLVVLVGILPSVLAHNLSFPAFFFFIMFVIFFQYLFKLLTSKELDTYKNIFMIYLFLCTILLINVTTYA